MITRLLSALGSAFVILNLPAHGCFDYSRPVDFISSGTGERAILMPEADFLTELCTHFGVEKRVASDNNARSRKYANSYDAHAADFAEILASSQLNEASIAAVRSEYLRFISDMRRPEISERSPEWVDGELRYPDVPPQAYEPTELSRYTLLAQFIPTEFELYLRGAACYHTERYEEAIGYWTALLELPEDLRRYRSIWAAYMLGRAWQELGSSLAVTYFEQTRELTRHGFRDTLALATESLGWQARAEWGYGHTAAALNHYLDLFRTGDPYDRQDAFLSLESVCWSVFTDDSSAAAAMSDPVARQIVSLWIVSGAASTRMNPRGATISEKWLDALLSANLEAPPLEAGRMAWLAYEGGNMALAERWSAAATEGDFAARWVSAKLLMRAGRLAEAEALLHDLSAVEPPYFATDTRGQFFRGARTLRRTQGELGVLLLNQGRYDESLLAFVRGNYLDDAITVAFGILDLDEAQKAIDRATDSGAAPEMDPWTAKVLRWNLAQSLARQGKYETALPYYPITEFASTLGDSANRRNESVYYLAAEFVREYGRASSAEESPLDRADSSLRAADLAMDFRGALFGDDYVAQCNVYGDWENSDSQQRLRATGIAEDLKKRLEAKAPAQRAPRPYPAHDYIAAELYWDAAKRLPDNDPRTARALWQGGRLIAPKDPQGADKFYKALVRRCGKLPIGKAADRLRWFPPEPEEWG